MDLRGWVALMATLHYRLTVGTGFDRVTVRDVRCQVCRQFVTLLNAPRFPFDLTPVVDQLADECPYAPGRHRARRFVAVRKYKHAPIDMAPPDPQEISGRD